MKNLGTKILGIAIIICLSSAQARDRSTLTLEGFIHDHKTELSDLKVTIYKNGVQERQFDHDNTFAFYYDLEANSVYNIKFEKEGYISKVLQFDTSIDDRMRRTRLFSFTLEMVKLEKEVDITSVLVAKVGFSEEKKRFNHDEEFTKYAKYQLANLHVGVEGRLFADSIIE